MFTKSITSVRLQEELSFPESSKISHHLSSYITSNDKLLTLSPEHFRGGVPRFQSHTFKHLRHFYSVFKISSLAFVSYNSEHLV